MESLIPLVLIFCLIGAVGWILGIAGFLRAGTALAELRELRRTVDRLRAEAPRAEREIAREPAPVPAEPLAAPVEEAAALEETRLPPEPALPSRAPARDIEALLTLRWGVWLGAAALLFAGVFLIRYAVEQELLGPAARCGLAALLGAALLAGAEWLHRHEGPPLPGPLGRDQAPAGLAAGGTVMLFGAAYGLGPFYGLIPPLAAFAALALASLLGLAAALRYGQLTAAVGLVGAFATPALVATDDPSLPGLFAYLVLVTAVALMVVRHTAWTWLGWAATAADALWLMVAGTTRSPDLWTAGLFLPATAALNLALLPTAALDHPVGRRLAWVPFAALAAAGLALEASVDETMIKAGLFLLSPIAVWRGATERRLDRLPWLAAFVGLLTLLLWALPAWQPTDETISIEGVVQAVLPGDWAPATIRPLILWALLLAVFHAAAGLWFERRAVRPLPWAALVAAVPVLCLAVAYAQVARFRSDVAWALAAAVLAAGLTASATLAARERALQRAGIHAAGAAAALALGCAMLLHDYWLSLAVALFLPPLAWIEERTDLPALRWVALAVAALVLVRLLANWYVPFYPFGAVPVANGLVPAYALPAALFALAARMFRRRADDPVVTVLEGGAVALAACFVALEIRHGLGSGRLGGALDFAEVALHVATLALQAIAYLHLARRTGRRVPWVAGHMLGGTALLLAILLLPANPAILPASAGMGALALAYLVPAALAVLARRALPNPRTRQVLAIYALVAGFVWLTLQIREWFHPLHFSLWRVGIEDAELWAWSGGWLAYGAGLMALGIRAAMPSLRLAALAVIGLVCLKVFLVDMSGLTGLWRVLSFLGLGLALIGLGVVQRRFVQPGRAG